MPDMLGFNCRLIDTWFSLLLVPVLVLCIAATAEADLSALDYLYTDDIPVEATAVAARSATQIVNGEIENARVSADELKSLQILEEDPAIRSRLLINYGTLLVALDSANDGVKALMDGITALEAAEGELSAALAPGLIALGIGQISIGEVSDGEESLARAQNLLHRENGVYALQQQDIVYHQTMLALSRNDFVLADRLQRFSLLIDERNYGENSALLVPTLTRLGSYLASRGSMMQAVSLGQVRPQHSFLGPSACRWGIGFQWQPCNPGIEKWQAAQIEKSREAQKVYTAREALFSESIAMFERAISIQESVAAEAAEAAEEGASRFDTLRLLSKVYLQKGDYRQAEQVLFRASKYASTDTSVDHDDHLEVALDLGDLLTVRSDSRASEAYLTAWRLAQSQEYREQDFFQKPQRLVPGAYRTLALEAIPEVEAGEDGYFALVRYDVSARGRVEDIRVVEANVPGAQLRSLRNELLRSRFRPRIEDGELVETRDLKIRFTYEIPG